MILFKLENFLKEKKEASLTEIQCYLGNDPSALKGMLELLIQKGKIKKIEQTTFCSGCKKNCASEEPKLYRWVE